MGHPSLSLDASKEILSILLACPVVQFRGEWFEMSSTQTNGRRPVRFGCRFSVFRMSVVVAAVCVCAALRLLSSDAAQIDLPRNALWEVVHNICVPGQSLYQDPKPCVQVDLKDGFAILRDPRKKTQFLLIPTSQISGIESPTVRAPNAPNYFADAWESRIYLDEGLHQTLPRDDVGLAINSAVSRTQDQFHIHFSCVRPDVLEALHSNETRIGEQWAPFTAPYLMRHYMAIWVSGEDLGANNPFNLLAETLPGAVQDMASRTLVVIGFTRADGTKGFVILAGHASKSSGDLANGEELLDPACHIAEVRNKSH